MREQTIFEFMYEDFKIDKPVRLIELFSGIGSQAKSLHNLGIKFEHWKAIEFDGYAMNSYNAIHGTHFETSDIRDIHANDLSITDTDKYIYIMTYSFPCTDLSLAGKLLGMSKGSGTRSGLLWEVERILDECENLPQCLLMENVPQVIGKKNIKDFQLWRKKLEELGYSNYVELLNAKDYGIPQNRNRCFMVSLLGNYNYTFPSKQKLNLRLKDLLEKEVDEKYYLSDEQIKAFKASTYHSRQVKVQNGGGTVAPLRQETTKNRSALKSKKITKGGECIPIKTANQKGYINAYEGDGIDISSRMQWHRGTVQPQRSLTLDTACMVGVVVKDGN